ncbi:hypothetical protein [Pelagerythrobacter marensis]|uniref:Glycerophosphoryl diester phosphodiesterase membrane domain-containing protein n=1 Tax=Pelagerythrobacter marensis TaxID=543877 RepID=A0A0G3X7F0_9SPHN|nr:hypothetical protein [Pelagerythrobacter marensis]AKM07097.1 hypothetical protein AM2010_1021 [Pelagerythrobacter marensis]
MNEKTSIGALLAETLSLVRDGGIFLAVFVAVVAVPTAFSQAGGVSGFDWIRGAGMGGGSGASAGLFVIGFIASVVQYVAGYLVLERLLELRDSRSATGFRIWAYVGLTILTMLGMVIGFFLLIVPGLIVAVRWSAAPGYLIGRDAGVVEAMQRSWDSTQGAGWAIFFAGLVLGCAVAVLAVVGTTTVELLTSNRWLSSGLAGLIDAISSALFLAFGVAVFLHVDDSAERVEGVFA